MEQHNIVDPFVGLVSIFMLKAVLLTRLQHLSAERTGSALSPQHLAKEPVDRLSFQQLIAIAQVLLPFAVEGKEVDWETVTTLDVIGIDEISLKKGHQDFVAIMAGRVEGKTVILGVLNESGFYIAAFFCPLEIGIGIETLPEKFNTDFDSACYDHDSSV
jgi:hypothetical protein